MSHGVAAVVMKNCDPAELGPLLAIETVPACPTAANKPQNSKKDEWVI